MLQPNITIPTKKVAILQSNYLPWKGYFDIIAQVDLFIFYDDVQYTKNDWRNRNCIKTAMGGQWLTIPCGSKAKRMINEVTLTDHRWQTQHWEQLRQHYRKAPFFKAYQAFFEDFYLGRKWTNLSELNRYLIEQISINFLNIRDTQFDCSSRFELTQRKGLRVLELLKKTDATSYLSGPAAKNYLDETDFRECNIKLLWMDYDGYPSYRQLHPPFEHAVSIVDLLFNLGDEAKHYIGRSEKS